ncbi:hypothetical protein [Embleya sp. MST-111070]|uniref:hypothetical protein n=1 Tax=Embleya sp. MST-111070 TaxID=3398231 RepID=UPI003F73DFA9
MGSANRFGAARANRECSRHDFATKVSPDTASSQADPIGSPPSVAFVPQAIVYDHKAYHLSTQRPLESWAGDGNPIVAHWSINYELGPSSDWIAATSACSEPSRQPKPSTRPRNCPPPSAL